ncbi:MAG: hypothetical protein II180_00925, partial [Proteobacteria bacterium]|nr:hypothetical protein [Pseudomonadota bacterium]
WATDRIDKQQGGIIGIISNKGWIDSMSSNGMRASLEKEFDEIYIYDLRGDQRTQGELSRKEGGKIFGSGSRTPIAMTFFVKLPQASVLVGEVSLYASISASPQYAATPSASPARTAGTLSKGEGTDSLRSSASIHYYAVADYLTREEKLAQIVEFKDITNDNYTLQNLEPDEHHDWLNQRNDSYQSFIPLECEKKFTGDAKNCVFEGYTRGPASGRDAWCYNSSNAKLLHNINSMIDYYNEQREQFHIAKKSNSQLDVKEFVDMDGTKISWDREILGRLEKNIIIRQNDAQYYKSVYRPFLSQHMAFGRYINSMIYMNYRLFPTPQSENLIIAVHGCGGKKDFTCLMSNVIIDLNSMAAGAQCFPLYYYDTAEDAPKKARGLFDSPKDSTNSASNAPLRHDGITDWILEKARKQYACSPRDVSRNVSTARQITKEDIFYYVYGILHSPKYRETFANDLKKSLPRIPLVEKAEDFWAFSRAGRELGALHVNYETGKMNDDVTVIGAESGNYIVKKMKFDKDKRILYYNSDIRIENIPLEVDEYIVNGRSALGWLVDQYQVSTDKASGIVNDPNDWAREHDYPRYILDLVLRIIELSVRTVEIVRGLPELAF